MKKLLLITEGFYDYDNAIKEVIEQEGYEVDLFEACVQLNYWEKVLHKKNAQEYLNKKQKQKQQKLLEYQQYDVVLVICGHSLAPELFAEFREIQKNARFILYLWDDIGRIKNYDKISNLFDKISTFDRYDAEKYNLSFRPLFYLNGYKYRGQIKKNKVCFVGWLHSDRVELVKKIVETYFSYENSFVYFLTGSYTLWKNRLSGKDNKLSRCMHTAKLSSRDSMKVLCESICTIDIQHPTQKGLTMRTIESLAAQTKLITTNEEVKYYDFYDPNNVCIIDRNNPIIPEGFLNSEWKAIRGEIENAYSLQSWVRDVIGGDGKQFLVQS